MLLLETLQDFQDAVGKANGLIQAAYQTNANGIFLWNTENRASISEAAFLKVFIAWECFLEKSFHLFMLGTTSISGKIMTRYVIPLDLGHATRIAIGGMKYVDWSNPGGFKFLTQQASYKRPRSGCASSAPCAGGHS